MSILNILNAPNNTPDYFTIYENAALDSDSGTVGNDAITFTTLRNFQYQNQVNVAVQPLENSDFASDSLQDNPFQLTLIGAYAPISTTSENGITQQNDKNNAIQNCIDQLDTYLSNTTLLTILGGSPLYKTYSNLKLAQWNYELSPERTVLYAYMVFMQIRMSNLQSGGLTSSDVSNSQNASFVNRGTINTQSVSSNSTLDDLPD